MISLFIFLHIIALILLVRSLWWMSKTYSIPLTFANFPIVGIWGVILLMAACLSVLHPWIYLAIGAPLGMFQFILESIDLPGRPNYTLPSKLLSALAVLFLWPELGSFTLFCVWHADKIVDEEPEP